MVRTLWTLVCEALGVIAAIFVVAIASSVFWTVFEEFTEARRGNGKHNPICLPADPA